MVRGSFGWAATAGAYESFASAQNNATIQPTNVHPARRLSQKIAVEFLLFLPIMLGRK